MSLEAAPVGAGAHVAGDVEMGLEREGDGGVRDRRPLRHMPPSPLLSLSLPSFQFWKERDAARGGRPQLLFIGQRERGESRAWKGGEEERKGRERNGKAPLMAGGSFWGRSDAFSLRLTRSLTRRSHASPAPPPPPSLSPLVTVDGQPRNLTLVTPPGPTQNHSEIG